MQAPNPYGMIRRVEFTEFQLCGVTVNTNNSNILKNKHHYSEHGRRT